MAPSITGLSVRVERSGRSAVYYPETGFWSPREVITPLGQVYLGSWRFCWGLLTLALVQASAFSDILSTAAHRGTVGKPTLP